jgi:hypothetical protein
MPDPSRKRRQPTRLLSRPMVGVVDRWPTSLAPSLAPGGLAACLGVHRPPVPRAGQTARPGNRKGRTMTEANVSFAGNLTDQPELRHTEGGIAGPCSGWQCRVGGSRRRRSSPWSCGATRPSMWPSRWAASAVAHRAGRDAPSPIGARRRGDGGDIVVRGETGDQTRSGIEKRRPRAAANVTAMDITIHASFLPHDDPSAAGQAHSYTSFIACGRSSNGRSEHEANAQEEAMPKR